MVFCGCCWFYFILRHIFRPLLITPLPAARALFVTFTQSCTCESYGGVSLHHKSTMLMDTFPSHCMIMATTVPTTATAAATIVLVDATAPESAQVPFPQGG